jgi:hypothetical protein
MRLTIFAALLAGASAVLAQSTSACAAQPVLNNCLDSTQLAASNCNTTDYGCLCEKWSAVVVYVSPLPILFPIPPILNPAPMT